MSTPQPGSTSQFARLLSSPPGFGVGWQEPVYLPAPPAGQGWSHVTDGRWHERLLAVTFTLATDSVVANRFPQLSLTDVNGTVIVAVPGGGTVTASSSLGVYLAVGGPAYAAGSSGNTFGQLPDVLVPPGWKWLLEVFGIDAGDQVSDVVLLVQRFPSDAVRVAAG